MRHGLLHTLACIALCLGLSACGSGVDDDAGVGAGAAPPPGATGEVGPAGGVVTAADGARVQVPAGALTAAAPIAIQASSAGAPPLPAGTATAGSMYALTPHGMTFAVPVTVTVPVDGAQVPAGAGVGLLKTNAAMDGWEPVTGATLSGGMLSASVSSFSWVVPVVAPATAVNLSGTWESLYSCDTRSGGGFSGEEILFITQLGASVSFTASDGSSGVGTLAGDTVTWTAAGPGYTESGTWTVLDERTMIKRSTYSNTNGSDSGTCAGSIHKRS